MRTRSTTREVCWSTKRYLVDHAVCLLVVYNGEWRGEDDNDGEVCQKTGTEGYHTQTSLKDFSKSRNAPLFSDARYVMISLIKM